MTRNCVHKARTLTALLAPLVLIGSQAVAQDEAPGAGLGTTAAKGLGPSQLQAMENRATPTALTAIIAPAVTFSNAQYATAGVALRNRGAGTIEISGIVAPVRRAYLYWAFLYSATPTAGQAALLCKPGGGSGPGNFSCISTIGARIATGPDTCWNSQGIAVYRADVTAFVTGNGEYRVKLLSSASAVSSGADPWLAPVVFPAAEGASLVVVGTGTRSVAIFDRGISAATFSATSGYTLGLPGGVKNPPVLWDHIGADGQLGTSRVASIANEATFINNVQISGPGASGVTAVTDSDWDGSAGWPLPQLWDDTGHSLSASIAPVGTPSLAVRFESHGDCLAPIANVVSY